MSDENPPVKSSASYASQMSKDNDNNVDIDDSKSYRSHGTSISEECFFADATLDLDEARGIAYTLTPDLTQKLSIDNLTDHMNLPALGNLGRDCDNDNDNDNDNMDIRPMGSFAKKNQITQVKSQDYPDSPLVAPSPSNGSSSPIKNRSHHNMNGNGNGNGNSNNDTQSRGANIEMHSIHNNPSTDNLNHPNPNHYTNQPNYRPRPPRRPRDSKWITAFACAVPFLCLPYIFAHVIMHYPSPDEHEVQKSDAPTLVTLLISIILARLFYLSRGGGDGEDRRYVTSQILIVANMASCIVLPTLTLTFYYLHVYSTLYHIIVIGLAYFTIREIYTFASLFKAININMNTNHAMSMNAMMNEGVNDGQRAFFRMLVNASLDILSRSLRCQSFYRTVVCLLCVQFGILMGLRRALEYSYRMGTFEVPWILLVVGVGYWCVNIVIRLLGYLACGGVTAWFAEQSILMDEMERMRKREEGDFDDEEDDFDHRSKNFSSSINMRMPEAYRNADARAYSLGIDFDEGMDDDYGDVDDSTPDSGPATSSSAQSQQWSGQSNSTVKAFLISGLGKSIGSIIHCALLGGIANTLWSFLRVVEFLIAKSPRFALFSRGGGQGQGYEYQGVGVENDSTSSSSGNNSNAHQNLNWIQKMAIYWQRFQIWSREFVRNHHDMGLCHVAAYYKSYTRAANDVMALIDASGIEPILHGDVSSHMCSSISKSIAGIVVIYVWPFLPTDSDKRTDITVCEIMVMTFAMCYVLIYTMMEPLRASIKAVYVCFAQNQRSLSQAFPILYHRLDRMSNERNMV